MPTYTWVLSPRVPILERLVWIWFLQSSTTNSCQLLLVLHVLKRGQYTNSATTFSGVSQFQWNSKKEIKNTTCFRWKTLIISNIWHRRKWLKRYIEILLELYSTCIEKCSKVIHNPIHVLNTILLNSSFLSRFVVDMKCLDHSAIKIKQKKTSFIFKLWCIDQNVTAKKGEIIKK